MDRQQSEDLWGFIKPLTVRSVIWASIMYSTSSSALLLLLLWLCWNANWHFIDCSCSGDLQVINCRRWLLLRSTILISPLSFIRLWNPIFPLCAGAGSCSRHCTEPSLYLPFGAFFFLSVMFKKWEIWQICELTLLPAGRGSQPTIRISWWVTWSAGQQQLQAGWEGSAPHVSVSDVRNWIHYRATQGNGDVAWDTMWPVMSCDMVLRKNIRTPCVHVTLTMC